MLKLHSILCPTDFSEFSDRAIRYACELAEKFQAEVHLLNVLQDYAAVAPGSGEMFVPFTDWLPELRKQSEEQLAKQPGPEWASKVHVHRTTRIGALLRIAHAVRERGGEMVLSDLSKCEREMLDVLHLGEFWTIKSSATAAA